MMGHRGHWTGYRGVESYSLFPIPYSLLLEGAR